MRRALVPFLLVCACGIFTFSTAESKKAGEANNAAPQPAQATPAERGPPPFTTDSARALAKRSAEEDLDCPMTQEEAGKMRDLRSGSDADRLAAKIGCACWVEYECDGPRRLSSHQCYLYESIKRYEAKADPGEDAALFAWGKRLYDKEKAGVSELSRAEPVGSDTPSYTDEEVRATALYEALEKGVRNMRENVRLKTWFLVPRYHKTFLANYDSLKHNVLCGGSHEGADKLHAEAAELQKLAKPKAKAWAKAERAANSNGTYRSLVKRADALERRAEKATNASGAAHLRDQEEALRDKADKIFERYLKQYGYYKESP